MAFINDQLVLFKRLIEDSITDNGVKGKTSMIRSSKPINLIHDAVKQSLIDQGVASQRISPHFGEISPEIKIAGFLKQKNQDVCVVPNGFEKNRRLITWGPLAAENAYDENGEAFSINTLVINVRSQMSSIAKNTDTLFERTFAEALNLHMAYPQMVTGEVYMIPVYEYNDSVMDNHIIEFKRQKTNVAKYISFFTTINNRAIERNDLYKYERCALLVVDFRPENPKLYESTAELIADGILSHDTELQIEPLVFNTFASDILSTYNARFPIAQLME